MASERKRKSDDSNEQNNKKKKLRIETIELSDGEEIQKVIISEQLKGLIFENNDRQTDLFEMSLNHLCMELNPCNFDKQLHDYEDAKENIETYTTPVCLMHLNRLNPLLTKDYFDGYDIEDLQALVEATYNYKGRCHYPTEFLKLRTHESYNRALLFIHNLSPCVHNYHSIYKIPRCLRTLSHKFMERCHGGLPSLPGEYIRRFTAEDVEDLELEHKWNV